MNSAGEGTFEGFATNNFNSKKLNYSKGRNLVWLNTSTKKKKLKLLC